MANAPNSRASEINGDVHSIFSSHTLNDKLSVANKSYPEAAAGLNLVTVTVDGFGAIDYRQTARKDVCQEEGEEELSVREEGGGDFAEEQSVDNNGDKIIIQRYTFTNRNQMTVQVDGIQYFLVHFTLFRIFYLR